MPPHDPVDTSANELEVLSHQRNSWNQRSCGWRKWDSVLMRMLKPAADAMLAEVPWKKGISILDVAAGTGELGLTAASIAREGTVLATDLAEGMIAVARESGRARGLTNFRTATASADQIPSADHTFDVVLCRFGFMFFPNIAAVLAEIKRVLRPGGSIVAAVWSSPPKNAWATTVMNEIRAHVDLPAPSFDAPGLFRFAQIEGFAEAFSRAGLRGLQFQEIEWTTAYGSPAAYWEFMTEISPPVVDGLATATLEARQRIQVDVLEAAARHERNGEVHLTCGSHVVTAIK